MVFMLVVMVTSLSLGGVASLTPRSTAEAALASAPASDSSDTFKHSLTHLTHERVLNYKSHSILLTDVIQDTLQYYMYAFVITADTKSAKFLLGLIKLYSTLTWPNNPPGP